MTVLLGLAAATIALVVLQQGRQVSDAGRVAKASVDANAALDAAEADLQQRLTTDPAYLLEQVWGNERARVCNGTPVQPGSPWPVGCGTTWSYTDAGSPAAVVAEVSLPTLTHDTLIVELAVENGGFRAGRKVVYRPAGTGWALWSDRDLDLTDRPAALTTVEIDGSLYAGGNVTLSGTHTNGWVVAEGSLTGTRNAANRYFASTIDASTPAIEPLTVGRARTHSAADLAGWVTTATEAACGGTTAAAGGNATQLCVNRGGAVLATNGQLVTIPATADRYLVIPNGSTLSIYTADADQITETGSCGSGCTLRSDAAAAVSAGTHPGTISSWTLAADAAWPVNGVAVFDGEVVVGLCGAGFVNGSCTTWSGPSAGARFEHPLTIIAGTLLDPADAWIGGPVHATAAVTVVATATLRLPYWAHSANGTLDVDAVLVGLAHTTSSAGGLAAFPRTRPVPTGANDPNWGAALNVAGLVAPGLELPGGFRRVTITAAVTPSPWTPGGIATWQVVRHSGLDAARLDALLD